MKFRCPFCFFTITVDESMRGYPTTCPGCAHDLTVPVSRFQEGCIIGDFLIKEKIGQGSIGTVYLATQLSLDRQVALKILSPGYTTRLGIRNFLKEARAAAALNHINLVQSIAIGEEDHICYMAMTYISGGSVADMLKRYKQLPVDESLHIIQQVAEALHYAWEECNIVHRDVKPDNIMVTQEGIVKLTDLGLALTADTWRDDDTEICGSPSYMAPEIFSGAKPGQASDIYSLGVTLYQMLTGKLPFDTPSIKVLAYMHQEEDPIPAEKLNPQIPMSVAHLIRGMMAKKPKERFQTMDMLLSEIWDIRQNTAPDRTLIPDVHTLSVRHLDYDIQRDSLLARDKVQKLENTVRYRQRQLIMILITIPFLILGSALLSILLYRHKILFISARESKLEQKLQYFQRLADDDSFPIQDLREQADKFFEELGDDPQNLPQQVTLLKIRFMIEQAELHRLHFENQNMLDALKSARAENARLQEKLNVMKSLKRAEK